MSLMLESLVLLFDINTIQTELYSLSNKEKIDTVKRFFKTEKGQYAETDVFLGINIPMLRKLSFKFLNASLDQLQIMLFSNFHEERMLSLLILVRKFQKSTNHRERDEIFRFYTDARNILQVNNWDLVDSSCRSIIGAYLMDNPLQITLLSKLAQSSNIWLRRISIVSTFEFIRKGYFDFTYKIISLLLYDEEDMVQKAIGWMLREIGKRDIKSEINYLILNRTVIPPKVLNYAMENFDYSERVLVKKSSGI